MKKYFCNVDTILVEGVRFNRGDEFVGVPAGSMDSMIRLRQATDAKPVAEIAAEAEEIQSPEVNPLPWDHTRIADLDVSTAIKKSLAAGGFSTVAEVIAFGEKHEGLQSIDGMTEAKEKAFQAAVEKLIPKSEG